MTTVRYAVLPAARIFNLTSPRWLPEISRRWPGQHPWHAPRYEPVRDMMESMYVDGFDRWSGHFELLEESVLEEGFRNPIMVSAGTVDPGSPPGRSMEEVPPRWRTPELIVSEYLGGSRLWVAQRHALDVPCIVNDHTGVLAGDPSAVELSDMAAVLERFTDTPARRSWRPSGVYLNNLPYMHIPEERRYNVRQQSIARRKIINDIRSAVAAWLVHKERR